MEKNINKWIVLATICLGGGVIYIFPYIQYTYYDSMMEALGFNHTQMGNILSIYGMLNIIAYLFGGVIADRIHYKSLLVFSLIGTGLSGFFFATFPSYSAMILLSIVWSITTIFSYWPAMIKAVKLLGQSDIQGRLFGFREAGFALAGLLFASIGLFIFRLTGENFSSVLLFYSIAYIACGVITFLFLPRKTQSLEDLSESKHHPDMWAGLRYAVKNPNVWLAGFLVFFAYSVGTALGRFAPYLTSVYKMGVTTAALVGIISEYLVPNLGAVGGGLVVDKVKSAIKVITWCFVLMGVLLGVFVALPGDPNIIFIVIIMGLSIKLVQSSLRGIYFVPVDEIGVPDTYVGTVVGMVSIIGFLPDAFIFTVWGRVLDSFSGEVGYRIIFSSLIVFCIVGATIAHILGKRTRNLTVRK